MVVSRWWSAEGLSEVADPDQGGGADRQPEPPIGQETTVPRPGTLRDGVLRSAFVAGRRLISLQGVAFVVDGMVAGSRGRDRLAVRYQGRQPIEDRLNPKPDRVRTGVFEDLLFPSATSQVLRTPETKTWQAFAIAAIRSSARDTSGCSFR